MMKERNIFLIGPRACGKTSVGRALAERLSRGFVDTDHELVATVGMEIAQYVEENGWEAFRDRETETLAAVAAQGPQVVGCGGGVVLREANRDILSSGLTIYLKASPEVLAERLLRDPIEAQRPSLTGKPVVEEVRDVLAARASLYEGCADVVVEGSTLEEVIDKVVQATKRLS